MVSCLILPPHRAQRATTERIQFSKRLSAGSSITADELRRRAMESYEGVTRIPFRVFYDCAWLRWENP